MEKTNQELTKHIKKRIKDPKFWIDNALLIILGIIIIIGQIDGMYIRNQVYTIETCEGTPTNMTLIHQMEEKGVIQPWNQTITTNQTKNYHSEND